MDITLAKNFKQYHELVELLIHRGMSISDQTRAKRKLAQVGYYRLSGYWYPCRELEVDDHGNVVQCPIMKRPKRLDRFISNTKFEHVFELYVFDKKLRVLMLDALERIEIYIRSVLAHELGKGKRKEPGTGELIPTPFAWQDADLINNKFLRSKSGIPTAWEQWQRKHTQLIQRSREDCILWYRKNDRTMPFWVVIEAWDFGTLSKYYGMLKDTYRQRICQRLSIEDKTQTGVLGAWLMEMNILRNRCAHHSRIWNQTFSSPLSLSSHSRFDDIRHNQQARIRLYGLIEVMTFLIEQLSRHSSWRDDINRLLAQFPALPCCNLSALGVPNTV